MLITSDIHHSCDNTANMKKSRFEVSDCFWLSGPIDTKKLPEGQNQNPMHT